MITTEHIALLALVVSLFALWQNYRSLYSSRLLAASEKKSQTHISLVETLLRAQGQKSILHEARNHALAKRTLPAVHETLQKRLAECFQSIGVLDEELHEIIQNIEERLVWLKSENTNDPILLGMYYSYANEVGLRIKDIVPKIASLQIHMDNVYEHVTQRIIEADTSPWLEQNINN